MRIDLLSANNPRPQASTPLRPMLGVGAIVEAVAVRDVSGQLWLQFDRYRVPARLASGHSAGPLEGEQLKLRVLRNTPVLALETLDEGDAALPERTAEEALRRYLPRQSSPTPLLANLGWLARNVDQLRALPPRVQQALISLWQRLPDATSLQDADTLRTALLRSGTFMESQLAQSTFTQATTTPAQVTNEDFKAGLLALRQQLRQFRLDSGPQTGNDPAGRGPGGAMPNLHAPLSAMGAGPASLPLLDNVATQLAELRAQSDGVLARINTNQLLDNQAALQGLTSWLIELPVRHEQRAELLRFKFEREPRRQGQDEDSWRVEVALDLGAAGALNIQVTLERQRLNLQLRSESAALVQALNDSLEILRAGLRAAGLEPERLVCLHGLPVDGSSTRLSRLLDLHA